MNRTARGFRPLTLVFAFTIAACTDDTVMEPSLQPADLVLAEVEATSVDLGTWTEESYNTASWTVASDGSSALQTLNGDPTFFYGDFEAFKTEVEGVIRVETTGDDDIIGFVLGFDPGDTESADADYLLVDWKKGTQSFTFDCTNTLAPIGLAVSRVTGAPSRDELWGHQTLNDGCSGEDSGVEELARGNTLGSTGWVSNTNYTFSFQFTATLLRVHVNGVLELEVAGDFSNGRLGFYNFSQSHVRYSAFTLEEFNNAPTAIDDAYEVDEDEELVVGAADGVLANDTDPDADDLAAVVVDDPANGTVTLNSDGSFTYTPAADYHGSDAFTYVAGDGELESDPATVAITVVSVNDPPVADPGGPYSADEGSSISLDLSGSDADGDALTYSWDLGDGTTGTGSSPPTDHTYDDNGTYTITLTVEDGQDGSDTETAEATIDNVAPSVTDITVSANGSVLTDPVPLGTEIMANAGFSDPGSLDTHTGVFDLDVAGSSGADAAATISGGTAKATHTYAEAGVYTLQLAVTDNDGGTGDSPPYEYVVVFDPDGGSVTGNGSIFSPAQACAICDDAEGEARFGFTSRYKRGATTPSGNTRFQFRAGDLRFKSYEYEWLVVSGPKAQFKGAGTINGAGDYGFLVTATDGELNGGGGTDRFRIKIWDRATDFVVYDNQPTDADDADATTALERGKIMIRSK